MQRTTIIALIVSICHVTGTLSMITSTSMNYTFPRITLHDFFEDDDQLSSSPLVYGSCLGRLYGNESSCQLTLEARRPTDSHDRLLTCDFKVSLPRDPARTCAIAQSRAATIAKDKALLILSQGCFHKWYVLHFSDCTVVPVEHGYDMSIRACTWGFFVQVPQSISTKAREESRLFDVMLDGPTRVMLRRLPTYIHTIGYDEWYYHPWTANGNAFLYSSTKGRVFIALDVDVEARPSEWPFKIFTVDSNGSNRTLKEYKIPSFTAISTSAMNELMTVCTGFNLTAMTCVQFDSDANIMFEMKVANVDAIYNLPGGGFNILNKKCLVDTGFKDYEMCPHENREITITKVDRTGSVAGSLKIPTFNCKHFPYVQFFEEFGTGALCFSQKCSDESYEQISLQIICFADEDYVR